MDVRITNTKSDNLKFAVYVRRSKYHASGESIENQIKMCKEYIFSHYPDTKDEDIFIYDQDDDISAKDTNRKDFQRMMESAKKKEFDYVVCYKTDRLNRKLNDFSNTHEFLKSKNIGIISVTQQFDTSNYNGRLHMNLLASVAEWEREAIAERVKDGMMYLATLGRKLGKTPTGFDSYEEKRIIVDGRVKTSHYLKTNEYIETVKIIFEKFIEFGSSNIVAKYLSKKEIKNPKGKYFFEIAIEKILKNPVYCAADKDSFKYFKNKNSDIYFDKKDFNSGLGIAAFNKNYNGLKNDESKWVIAVGKHPGVISGKDWVAVQNIFAKKIVKPRVPMKSSLLSGLIKCELCGGNMRLSKERRQDRLNTHRYICGTKASLGKTKCSVQNLNGPKIEDLVVNYIMHFDENKFKKDLNIGIFTCKVNKFDDKLNEINFIINELINKKNNLLKYLDEDDGDSFFKDVKNRINNFNEQIDKLKAQKQVYETQFNLASEEKYNIDQILKNIKNFKKNYHSLDFDHKKSLLRLVVDKLTWNGIDLKIFLTGEKI